MHSITDSCTSATGTVGPVNCGWTTAFVGVCSPFDTVEVQTQGNISPVNLMVMVNQGIHAGDFPFSGGGNGPVHDGRAAGRLIVDRSGDDILLIDVALLPEFRNAGMGSELMRQVMAEAARAQKALKLHVEKVNRARHLYDRLGFSTIGDNGIYLEMMWKPKSTASSSIQRNSA